MAEERVTETRSPDGNTHTHTTVIEDGGRSGGGAGWLIALLILVAIVIGENSRGTCVQPERIDHVHAAIKHAFSIAARGVLLSDRWIVFPGLRSRGQGPIWRSL